MTKSTKRRLYSRKGSRSRKTKHRNNGHRVRSKRRKYHKGGMDNGWLSSQVNGDYGYGDDGRHDLDGFTDTTNPTGYGIENPKPSIKNKPYSPLPTTSNNPDAQKLLKEMAKYRDKRY